MNPFLCIVAQNLEVLPLYVKRVDCNNSELTLYRHKLIIQTILYIESIKTRCGLARLKWKPNQFKRVKHVHY